MANRLAFIKQADMKRLFKAGIDAGFEVFRVTIHPDGRIEAEGSLAETALKANSSNTWDDVLK